MFESTKGKYFVGKIKDFSRKKGWFFGHFMTEELLHSDLVEVAYQHLSFQEPTGLDKHYHQASLEINLIISGSIKFILNGKSFFLKKGDFWVVYPETVIEKFSSGKDTRLVVIKAPSLPGDKITVEAKR